MVPAPLYQVEFAPRVEKQLKLIPKNIRDLILNRIEKLQNNPRPENVEPLQGLQKIEPIVLRRINMRSEFKKIAQNNTLILDKCFGKFIDGVWNLAKKVSEFLILAEKDQKNISCPKGSGLYRPDFQKNDIQLFPL